MDYSKYEFSKKEIAVGLFVYSVFCATVAYFFYRAAIVFFILLPGSYVFFEYYRKRLIDKRKKKLSKEFSQTLYSVISSLRAGYSIENAFIEAGRDVVLFYGEDSLMALEIDKIKSGLEMNFNLEDLVDNLGSRSKDDEIMLFADVFKCAKRNGGNITEVLSETADRIQERICIDTEIDLMISEKKLELRIMEIMPFFILVYLDLTSRGYFDILYSEFRGRLVMTGCLAVYAAAVVIAEKIVNIKL